MTDRELLELAAKAAGIEFDFCRPELGGCQIRKSLVSGWWNPLTDDGDALRLAVKLRLGLVHSWELEDEDAVATVWISHDGQCLAEEIKGDDPYAATRRAIVRAAAALGETE